MAKIKIDEKELNSIISESLMRIIQEDYSFTDEEYALNNKSHEGLSKIYDAAFELGRELAQVNKSNVSQNEYNPKIELYGWVKKILQDADEWNKRGKF